MPVQRCQEGNKPGWRCGQQGKCYTYTEGDAASEKRAKKRAIRQCIAIGETPSASAVTAAAPNQKAAEQASSVVRRAMRRAAALEPLMARAILPTLDRTADEAARRFARLAGDGDAWQEPASAELVDVAALVAQLRKKLDPVMLRVLRTVQEAIFADEEALTAAGAGISFDVKNPYTAAVLDRTAAQITSVAETTRTQVRKVMADSYAGGLSVPDTAKEIRARMKRANRGRATLIARTEFTGMVNGGSLAAASQVEDASGQPLFKKWLTGPGAPHPRHETYAGLNGQVRKLKDAFDVNGYALMYPGDPNGPPGEVCNCRCAVAYTDERPDDQADPSAVGLPASEASLTLTEAADLAAQRLYPGNPEFLAGAREAQQNLVENYAAEHLLTPEEYLAAVDQRVADIVAGAPVQVRATGDALENILADGRFKSQFESGQSRGLLDYEARRDAERRLFGYPADLADDLRPIYGYLGGSDSGYVGQYGSIVVRLDANARARASVTLTDSLEVRYRDGFTARPLAAPDHAAVKFEHGDPLAAATLADAAEYYAEVQVHGGVHADEIAEVVFTEHPDWDAQVRMFERAVAEGERDVAAGVVDEQSLALRRYQLDAARERRDQFRRLTAELDRRGISWRTVPGEEP